MTLVVAIHYGNELSFLKQCVNSFLQKERNINFLIVNNNKSPLKSSDIVDNKTLFVLNSKKNLGYGGGFNLATTHFLYKKAENVLLVNSDAYINDPIIESMCKILENDSVGIVGPVVEYTKDNKSNFDLGGFINKNGSTYHIESDRVTKKEPLNVEFLGVCLLIKKSLIQKLNGFDENFFLYYEDVDFCLRAKEKGYKVIVDPSSVIFHDQSKSVGKDSKLAVYSQTKSAILYMKKHLGRKKLLFFPYLIAQSLKRFYNNPLSGAYAFKAIIESL